MNMPWFDAEGNYSFRMGLDIGGSKIELALLIHDHCTFARERLTDSINGYACIYRQRDITPDSYPALIQSIGHLLQSLEQFFLCEFGKALSQQSVALGVGLPGKINAQGLVENSNTHYLNQQPIQSDLLQALPTYLQRSLVLMNDANCFALSESMHPQVKRLLPHSKSSIVFGLIIGTGVGGGIVINDQLLHGCNNIAGEWGHTRFPKADDGASRPCYCSQWDCVETYLSGAGLVKTYTDISKGANVSAQSKDSHLPGLHHQSASITVLDIIQLCESGDLAAAKALLTYQQQLVKALTSVVNILDPDVIVLGGGLSNIEGLAEGVEQGLSAAVFSEHCATQVRQAKLGDSSGVFGAAYLPDFFS